MNPRCKLFYDDGYVYDVVEHGWRHAFDIRRPRKIRDALIQCGAADGSDFHAPHVVTEDELLLVHTPAYLAEISDPATLARYLLLDGAHPWDERLLRPFRLAAGGTVEALRATAFERRLGINLGGGFHHAQADRTEGFCAIADVAVAIRVDAGKVTAGAFSSSISTITTANGNALIFANDESVFTFSMHNFRWCYIDKRNNLDIELPPRVDDHSYLMLLRHALPEILDSFAPETAIYVAGSDPHVEDLFGDADLSFRGLLDRDRYVTTHLLERDIPFTTVTAGGYGPESWRVHFNYYQNGASRARRCRDERAPAWTLRFGGAHPDLRARGCPRSRESQGIRRSVRHGQPAGAAPPHVRLRGVKAGRRHLLFDARLTEAASAGGGAAPCEHALPGPLSLAVIFWACEQDPTEEFSARRPRLPLQGHPGLGILRHVFRAGVRMAVETAKDGLANMPKFPHDALIFNRSLRFLFLDPAEQGRLDALSRDLDTLGLRDLSLAIVGGAVKTHDGRAVQWRGGLQVYPLSSELSDYFKSGAYERARADARSAVHYTVDMQLVHAALRTFETGGDRGGVEVSVADARHGEHSQVS